MCKGFQSLVAPSGTRRPLRLLSRGSNIRENQKHNFFNLVHYFSSFDIHLVHSHININEYQSHIKMLSLMLLIVVIFIVSTILKSISLCAQCKRPTLIEQINKL